MFRSLMAMVMALVVVASAGVASAATQTYAFSGSYPLPATGGFSGTFVYDDGADIVISGSVSIAQGFAEDGVTVRPAAVWTFLTYDSAQGRIGFATSTPANGQQGFMLRLTDLVAGAPIVTTGFEGTCGNAGCTQLSYPGGSGRNTLTGLIGIVPVLSGLSPASGPVAGGTIVTLTGTSFTGATAVTFGGTPATTFVVDSATQITATAPAGVAGLADVSVTTPDGTTANTVADDFIYIAPAPVPTLTEWAMILLGLVLAGGAVVMIQRRRTAA